jgi:Phage virion morphogenesis family
MTGLSDLAARLAELEAIPSRIAKDVADRIEALIAEEFASEHDAYGRPWAPLLPQTVRRKRGDTRILKDTGALAGATQVRATAGAGIEITSIETGQYHQTGTKHMVPRKILPDGSDLPLSWEQAISDATDAAFNRVLK